MALGECAKSTVCGERALEVVERGGSTAYCVFVRTTLAVACFFVGDWTQARLHLEHALTLSREIGAPRVIAAPVVELGRLCLAEGAWEDTARYLEEGVALGTDVGLLVDAQVLLAERDILEGRPETARARLAPLGDHPDALKWSAWLLPVTAWAHLERGAVRQANDVVAQAINLARATNYRLSLVHALWVQAMVATRQERWEEAQQALEEGLPLVRGMPYPYAEARLLYVYGEMHAQQGEPEAARERLEAALAIFRRLGARKDAERAEQALAALAA
jgi:uncharacterized protein HemY